MQSPLILAKTLLCFIVLATISGCRASDSSDHASLENAPLEQIEIFSNSSFSLSGSSTFTMKVVGCKSQFSATVTEQTSALRVYKNDLGCVAQLLDFSFDNRRYTVLPGKGFKTWAVGESAQFISADQLSTLTVRVKRQLSSPILATDRVEYSISEALGNGSVKLLNLKHVATGNSTKSPHSPLRFALHEAKLVGWQISNQSAKIQFQLGCELPLSDKHFPECDGNKLRDLDYVLLKDTFPAEPCPASDPSACGAHFGSTSLDVQETDIIFDTPAVLPNGGFRTVPLLSPGSVVQNPNMTLLLKAKERQTVQWFRVSLQVKVEL